MNEEIIYSQWKLWRSWVHDVLDRITEEQADMIPEPYNNSVRWNAGHILVSVDGAVTNALGIPSQLPASYPDLFATGTSPKNWGDDVPSLDELKKYVIEQPEQLRAQIEGKLDTPLPQPFMKMTTLGEVVVFMFAHDAMHLTSMKYIRKAAIKNS